VAGRDGNEMEGQDMGKLIVTEFISVDGVIDSPGELGWVFKFDRGEDGNKFKVDELTAAEVQLLGRITYQGFAQAWPSRSGDEFSDKMNTMPKYVASTTLTAADATWENSTVISADVAGAVTKLKQQVAGDILVAGSGNLVRTLAEHDLVDEYRLMTFPIVLGTGKRLFTDGFNATDMRLVECKPVGPDGVVILTYEPAR
jgi:dihydrofolate reductase